MCCFSRPRPAGLLSRLFARPAKVAVSGTRIFARVDGTAQWLVYAMALDTPSDVAMVLPLPAGRVADDALEFVDLSGYPRLFDQLGALFDDEQRQYLGELTRGPAPQSKRLVVHEVGSFEASYVPSLPDMNRLDPRFRIPDEVWAERAEYARYGFAVFKLKKGKGAIHPMAMRFHTAEPGSLFFPTVHVHDGALHDRAEFDHTLYFQAQATPETELLAVKAARAIDERVTIDSTKGIAIAGAPVYRVKLHGERDNTDTRVALASPIASAA